MPSFLLAEKAEVANVDVDADEMAAALAKEYPGLPRTLHENYVLAVWKAVYDLPEGRKFEIRVSQQQALLVDCATRKTISLWERQPLE